MGDKRLSTPILVATIFATHLGAGATLGLIEQISNVGIICAILTMIGVIRWSITKAIFSSYITNFKGCISQATVMQKLYGNFGLWSSNISTLIISIGLIAGQVMVMGFVFQYFFGLSSTWGIAISGAIITTYSTSGGIKAVILTDLLQMTLFCLIIAIVFWFAMERIMVEQNVLALLPQSKVWVIPHDWHSAMLVIGVMVYSIIPIGGDAPFIQRLLISGSPKQLKKTFSYVAILDLLVIFAISCIAVVLLPTVGDGSITKGEILSIVESTMHPVVVNGIALGLLAITMSTADSWLNAAAVTISHDIVKWFKPKLKDADDIRNARLATISLGLSASLLALYSSSLMSVILLANNFYHPIILIPIAA
ncbi:MAG: hypothetical protein JSS50_02905, partial [Proteobacteria bacterium]|nr:hypothetical protein [Pseudomonadota bacterium]